MTATTILSPASMAETNTRVLEAFYDAFVSNEVDAAARWVTDDFIMHVPGTGPNAGEHWGKEGLRRFVGNISAHVADTFSLDVTTVAVSDAAGFTREVVRANRKADPGVVWELRFVMEYRFKAGLISEAWTIPEDQHAYDAFWKSRATTGAAFPTRKRDATLRESSNRTPFDRAISPDNQALVLDFYGRFWRGDMAGIESLYADDFVFETFGWSALAGEYPGFAGYLEFRDKLAAHMGNRYKLEIDSIAAGETDVFVRERVRMNRDVDQTVRTIYVILHIVVREGKFVRIDDIPVDTYAYDEFFWMATPRV